MSTRSVARRAPAATAELSAADGVKSADRAMAIFELFRELRRPAGAREIASALAMPRSSTTVLLRSLIAGGYLRFDEVAAQYFPTLKVMQLGNWLVEGYLNDPAIDGILRELVEITGETVCVWGRIGQFARILRVIPSPQAISLTLTPGMSAPLAASAVGVAFLMRCDDADVADAAAAYNRTCDAARKVNPAQLMKSVGNARARGVSVGYHMWLPDSGAIVATLDPAAFREVIAVAVGGPEFRIRRNEERFVHALLDRLRPYRGRRPKA